ncbi:MAG TPA: transglycosylase SLT domain-containing protein [Burkholderiales bacterium]|nr:transglycosylase SLT domain-containing protein [Burkholderiales bacterium]
MIFKYFRNALAALAVLAAPLAAFGAAAANDDAVLGAYDAYRAGDALKLARFAKKLDGHPLDAWIDYWRVAMRLDDTPASEVHAFFAEHPNTYVAEVLRGDWLKVLGKRAAWDEFERELALYPREDLEIRCYASLKKVEHGEELPMGEADWMWLEPAELPEGCAKLVDRMLEDERISVADVWRRVRLLFARGQITAAKTALGYLAKSDSPDERMLAEAARQPKRVLDRLPKTLDKRPVREVVVLAAIRYARNEPEAMAKLLEGTLASRLPEADVHYLWGRVAYEGAREHHPEALKWFAHAAPKSLDDDQLAWKVRAALRAARWSTVKETIDLMPVSMRHESTWTYWYGRALAAQGEETGSRAYFMRIAGQTDFYGLLASEELGYVSTVPESVYIPTDEEVELARATPGLARSIELIRLGMRTEGVREWLFSVRYFGDEQLLAAAEFARREGIWDRSISAADRTVRSHNFALRYPLPYRELFSEYAKTYDLDEAWILGLVRQESRFITDARSNAGAAGLMQVMPRTARFVAQKIGLRRYDGKSVTEAKTNITLGAGYLRLVLDQLGHPVLASAAYNAGPGRAKRWRDTSRALEGAVYAETIPFAETRDYVKKVMANAVFYAALTQKQVTPLKARLGTIPPRGTAEPVEDDLP